MWFKKKKEPGNTGISPSAPPPSSPLLDKEKDIDVDEYLEYSYSPSLSPSHSYVSPSFSPTIAPSYAYQGHTHNKFKTKPPKEIETPEQKEKREKLNVRDYKRIVE